MPASLYDRLSRLGPVRAVPRTTTGYPMKLSLRPATNLDIKTVSATMALAKRGLSLLKAKRAVEEMVANGLVLVELPMVEDRAAVESDLAAAGICATPAERP